MSVFDYIKQRWFMFLAIIVAGVFSFLVYFADGSGALLYALEGIVICFLFFIIADFFVLRSRVKRMERFLSDEDDTVFSYPLDRIYAKKILAVIERHKQYRESMEMQHTREIEFITKWVHDVKVPISAIRLISDRVDDEAAQQLEMQTLHVEQNIQKILFHIKSKRFHEDYDIKQVNLKAIISTALKQYAVFFSYKKISLVHECEDIKVATDEKWSGYIISQIISNAVKYTPEGGQIEIRAYKQGEKTIVCIKNTGSSIDLQSLKQIFKRGFSGSTVRRGASTGYGLYLSKKLADIMGHELYAESNPGKYSEFFLVYNMTKL